MLEWNQAETRVPETVLHPFTNRKERQRALDIFLQVTATKGRVVGIGKRIRLWVARTLERNYSLPRIIEDIS